MADVFIQGEERYPLYQFYGAGEEARTAGLPGFVGEMPECVPDSTIARWRKVFDDFEAVQDELAAIVNRDDATPPAP